MQLSSHECGQRNDHRGDNSRRASNNITKEIPISSAGYREPTKNGEVIPRKNMNHREWTSGTLPFAKMHKIVSGDNSRKDYNPIHGTHACEDAFTQLPVQRVALAELVLQQPQDGVTSPCSKKATQICVSCPNPGKKTRTEEEECHPRGT